MTKQGEDGYELWLRYRQVAEPQQLTQYRRAIAAVAVLGKGKTFEIITNELKRALPGLLDTDIPIRPNKRTSNALVMRTVDELEVINVDIPEADRRRLGEEEFLIRSHHGGMNTWVLVTGDSPLRFREVALSGPSCCDNRSHHSSSQQ